MDIPQALDFLRAHHRAVLATTRRDGSPQLSPVAVGVDADGLIVISSRETAVKIRNLRRDPRVSLTVLDEESWYTHVSVLGRVVDLADDTDLSGIDSLSRHYGGRPYPDRESPRVDGWIEVDRYHGWGRAG